MNKKRIFITGALGFLVAGGLFWRYRARVPDEGAVREERVERGRIDVTILTTGQVTPRNRLEIKPPIPGRAESILVREGDAVRRGQVLAWMSSTERAALLDAARAKGSAELARWEDLYKPTPLVAPVAGLVIARNVEPGQTVTAQDAVLVMSDRLILKGQVDETDVGQVRVGQEAGIVLDAYPGRLVPGRVEHIAFEAQTVNNVTIYEVDVLPDQVPPFMRSGMTANITFLVERKEGVLTLPASAVRESGGGASVRVAAPGGKSETREVKTGLSNGKTVEILSGLSEGDVVYVADGFAPAAPAARTNPLSPMPRPRRAR